MQSERDPGPGYTWLVQEVVEPVRRYLRRRTDPTTADDVLAETMVVLWRRFHEVPQDRVPWAIGVARLQLQNAQRAVRRQGLLTARVIALDPPTQALPGPEDEPDGDDDRVRAVLAQLSPADQELLRLSAWDELAPAAIARVLGISSNAAAIRLHRARRRFAHQWQQPVEVPAEQVDRGRRA